MPMLTNYIWLIVLQLSTIKLCKSAHATTRTYFERRFMTTAILNQHFQSTLLGGGHKKEYAVYARENDDNYGRPLT